MIHLIVRGKDPLPQFAAESLVPEIVASLLHICGLSGEFILIIKGEGFLGAAPLAGIKIVSIFQKRLLLHVVGRESSGRYKCLLSEGDTDPNKLMKILIMKMSRGWYHYDPVDQPAEIQRTVTPDTDERVKIDFRDPVEAVASLQRILLYKNKLPDVKKLKAPPQPVDPLKEKIQDMAGKAARYDRAVKRIQLFELLERQAKAIEDELAMRRKHLAEIQSKYDEDKKIVEDDEFKKARLNLDKISSLINNAE